MKEELALSAEGEVSEETNPEDGYIVSLLTTEAVEEGSKFKLVSITALDAWLVPSCSAQFGFNFNVYKFNLFKLTGRWRLH